MKNRLRLISYIIIATLLIPNIVLAELQTVITDSDASWTMQWNWERYQEGFEYVSSEIRTENGLKLTVDTDKYNAVDAVKYSTDGNGNPVAASGEYKYSFRVDSDGNAVAYDKNDTTSTSYIWYHQGRNNYSAKFNVGETENTGEPIVLSYDFDITATNTSWWNSPRLEFMDFTIRHDVGGNLQIVHSGGNLDIEKNKNIQNHSISVVIAPTVTNGRYEMLGIMLDGEVIPMSGIYSTKTGKTDADCYLSSMNFVLYLGPSESAELTNLSVVRGFDDIVLSTDFADGSEIGNDGINISSSVPLKENTGEITVYDCDFDGELVADPGAVITYNNDVINAMFTKLEGGGNYRMELTGVEDIWGNKYTDTLSVNFATPAGESGGDIDDTPDEEAGGNDISVGDIAIGSSNTLYHGHNFYEASKTDDEFEVVIDNAEWWYAEEHKFGENNNYYYTDKDGNKTLIGYGNESWNKLDLDIKADEKVNPGEPLVVSYDWNAENVGKVSEWGSYYMNIMGVYCFISEYSSTETMLKYYENGTSVTKAVNLKATADGWHNIKLVFSPTLKDGRTQVTAVIVDGEITFYDNMYSTVNTYSDDTFVMNGITLNVAKPTEAKANNGDSIVKLRNVELKRVDGLKAEMFMPLGVQNPKEAIKLNFNYPVSDALTGKDFKIYEISEDGEKAISNELTVSKAYDDKQVLVTVGDGGLYYDRDYKLVIDKNIIVEDYISISQKEYEFSTYEYPDDLSAELTRSGDTISYNISGGGDSFVIMVSTYDTDGALVGLNCITAQKEGSGDRQKARGSVSIKNADSDTNVMLYIFTNDGKMKLYRMPTEF